jgi:hypothetical protein
MLRITTPATMRPTPAMVGGRTCPRDDLVATLVAGSPLSFPGAAVDE